MAVPLGLTNMKPHPELAPRLIRGMTPTQARRHLQSFGCTHGECDLIIHMAREKNYLTVTF